MMHYGMSRVKPKQGREKDPRIQNEGTNNYTQKQKVEEILRMSAYVPVSYSE